MRLMRNMHDGAIDWYVDMATVEASRRRQLQRPSDCKFPCQLWMRHKIGGTGSMRKLEMVNGITNGYTVFGEWWALRKSKRCVVCNTRTRSKCSGCNSIFYCSPACQAANWNDHQLMCKPRTPDELRERLRLEA